MILIEISVTQATRWESRGSVRIEWMQEVRDGNLLNDLRFIV